MGKRRRNTGAASVGNCFSCVVGSAPRIITFNVDDLTNIPIFAIMFKSVIPTIVSILWFAPMCTSQTREVAITIDDVPNVQLARPDDRQSLLLSRIDSLNLPVTVFINEHNLYRVGKFKENRDKLWAWLRSENITAGNHGYSHVNYGDTTLVAFQREVLKGELITRELTGQAVRYFRFPFNSLGKDSIAHGAASDFLRKHGYTVAPFTIESEDWAFNSKYENALKSGKTKEALEIGRQYLNHTLALFGYFETLSVRLYGRNIKHIYLCHDSQLNTDYLVLLAARLQQKGYSFINLEESLKDPIYNSPDYYFGNYGFSWIYRWQADVGERKMMMQKEPRNKLLE